MQPWSVVHWLRLSSGDCMPEFGPLPVSMYAVWHGLMSQSHHRLVTSSCHNQFISDIVWISVDSVLDIRLFRSSTDMIICLNVKSRNHVLSSMGKTFFPVWKGTIPKNEVNSSSLSSTFIRSSLRTRLRTQNNRADCFECEVDSVFLCLIGSSAATDLSAVYFSCYRLEHEQCAGMFPDLFSLPFPFCAWHRSTPLHPCLWTGPPCASSVSPSYIHMCLEIDSWLFTILYAWCQRCLSP